MLDCLTNSTARLVPTLLGPVGCCALKSKMRGTRFAPRFPPVAHSASVLLLVARFSMRYLQPRDNSPCPTRSSHPNPHCLRRPRFLSAFGPPALLSAPDLY